MKKLFFLFSFLICNILFAQTFEWARRIGGTAEELGFCITGDAFGNLYTAGTFMGTTDFNPGAGVFELTSNGSRDVFVCKLDGSGNFVWAKAFGGIDAEDAKSISIDAFGNVYTTGSFRGTADFDPGTGTFNLTTAGGLYDIYISKLDSSGNFVWAKSFSGTSASQGNSITTDPSGNVYTTGPFFGTTDFDPGTGSYNLTSGGSGDIFISKLNTSGNFLWAKSFQSTSGGTGISIKTDNFGNVISTGTFKGSADFDPGAGTFSLNAVGQYDIFVSKLDTSGNFKWAKTFGGVDYDKSSSMAIDLSGNVFITGHYEGSVDFDPGAGTHLLTSVGGYDIFVSKLDSAGGFEWAKTFGETAEDEGIAVAVDNSGNIFTTGWFELTVDFDPGSGMFNLTSNGNNGFFILKLDNAGNFGWAKSLGGTADDHCSSMFSGSERKLFITGYFHSLSISFGTSTLINANNSSSRTYDVFISKIDGATGIESINRTNTILVFPNPFSNELTISSSEKILVIEVYDIVGRKISEYAPFVNSYAINNSQMNSGMYFLKAQTISGTQTLKIIKQ